ncbi:GNAT family N-acetyltransferase [Halomonas korlensis]|nr:GNAT family N-acetyltransferase [Halomonas korlensis]
MPHCDAGVSPSRAMVLLAIHRAYLIRWESDFDCETPTEWWHVIKSEPEELEALSANTRSKVRRGDKRFLVEPASRKQILETGHAVYCKAYERYDTFEPMMTREDFCEAIMALPAETEFWVVRHRQSGEMVAFSENLVSDDACFYLSIWSTPDSLRQYASYALIYRMNLHYLNERGLRYVSDGARSISHNTGIHDFLIERFGFRKAYARLHVVYFPLLSPVVFALYPFRQRISQAQGPLCQKVNILLKQEAIRRSFKRHRTSQRALAN